MLMPTLPTTGAPALPGTAKSAGHAGDAPVSNGFASLLTIGLNAQDIAVGADGEAADGNETGKELPPVLPDLAEVPLPEVDALPLAAPILVPLASTAIAMPPVHATNESDAARTAPGLPQSLPVRASAEGQHRTAAQATIAAAADLRAAAPLPPVQLVQPVAPPAKAPDTAVLPIMPATDATDPVKGAPALPARAHEAVLTAALSLVRPARQPAATVQPDSALADSIREPARSGDAATTPRPLPVTVQAAQHEAATPKPARPNTPAGVTTIETTAATAADLQPAIALREPATQATGAPPPLTTRAAPGMQGPHDFTTLVERLVEAREAAAPHAVRAALVHADFGQVSLNFRADDGRIAVQMASADPAFAPAAQAAAQQGASDSSTSPRQDGQPAQQQPANGQQAQQQSHTQNQQRGETSNRSARAEVTSAPTPDAEPGETDSTGIYA
jgi:hypothetical protein